MPGQGKAITNAQRRQILALYPSPMSAKRVAKLVGCHAQTVLNVVRLHGETVRPPFVPCGGKP